MAIDPAELGKYAAEFMDTLEAEYGEQGTLVTFAIVAEIDLAPDDENPAGATEIRYTSSEQRRWVQAGFFEAAKRAVYAPVVDDDDDPDDD